MGLWPATVTVSATSPTFSSALMGTVFPAVTSTPPRLTVLKPVSVNPTL